MTFLKNRFLSTSINVSLDFIWQVWIQVEREAWMKMINKIPMYTKLLTCTTNRFCFFQMFYRWFSWSPTGSACQFTNITHIHIQIFLSSFLSPLVTFRQSEMLTAPWGRGRQNKNVVSEATVWVFYDHAI